MVIVDLHNEVLKDAILAKLNALEINKEGQFFKRMHSKGVIIEIERTAQLEQISVTLYRLLRKKRLYGKGTKRHKEYLDKPCWLRTWTQNLNKVDA